MKKAQHWYRISVDLETGKVLTCTRVEKDAEDGIDVYYVRASDKAEAGRLAFNAYCKLRLRARRKKLRDEGKCRCGRERDKPDRLRCSWCIVAQRNYRRREAAKKRGEEVPPANHKGSREARRQAERDDLRLEILLEVETKRCGMGPARFAKWLDSEIAKLRGRKAA